METSWLEMGKEIPPHETCGAIVSFEGVVRSENDGKKVGAITYECYPEMARKMLEEIVQEIKAEWKIHTVRIRHRIGKLSCGETSIVMQVCSPHRREAFAASLYLIDELKKRVPIWKKEHYEGGKTEWLGG